MTFNINFVGSLVMGCISLACFGRLWLSYRQERTEILQNFAKFFGYFAVFQLIIGMPQLIGNLSSAQLGSIYLFGHIFLIGALAYYSRIPAFLVKPGWENKAFAGNILIGAIFILINMFSSEWVPNYFAEGGQVFVYEMSVTPILIGLIFVNWIIGGTLVFGKMAWEREGPERVKSALLAIGMALAFIGGPLHAASLGVSVQAIAEGTVTLGLMVIFFGIYYKKLLNLGQRS